MLLGLSRPGRRHASRSSAWRRAPPSRTAWSPRSCRPAACSRTSPSRETVELTAALFAHTRPVDEVLDRAGLADIAGRRVGKCSGGAAAAAALRHGAAARARAARPRRADHRHGRRGPPRLLGRHPRRRRARAARSCSPPTTSRRPTPTPTGSCWSAAAGSSPTAPPRRSRRCRPAGWSPPPGRRRPPRPPRCTRLPGVEDVELRGDTVLVRSRRLRRRRPAPAHRHPRARPGDHLPRPRGRLPRPDRTRREHPMTAAVTTIPDRRVPPLGGFSLDLPAARDPPDAAQPPDPGLHADHAAGVLPALRRAERRLPAPRPPAAATSRRT